MRMLQHLRSGDVQALIIDANTVDYLGAHCAGPPLAALARPLGRVCVS